MKISNYLLMAYCFTNSRLRVSNLIELTLNFYIYRSDHQNLIFFVYDHSVWNRESLCRFQQLRRHCLKVFQNQQSLDLIFHSTATFTIHLHMFSCLNLYSFNQLLLFRFQHPHNSQIQPQKVRLTFIHILNNAVFVSLVITFCNNTDPFPL